MDIQLTFADLLYTVSYALNIGSFMMRRMLYLRIGVLVATLGFLVFSFMLENLSMIAWNAAFVGVNTIQLVRLIMESRSIELGPSLDEIHKIVFNKLSKRDFLYFWEMGWEKIEDEHLLLEQGKETKSMYYLVKGNLEVIKNSKVTAEVGPNHFVGEMSFLTGKESSADVRPIGKVLLREWNMEKIRSLKKLKPELYQSVVEILGVDLSKKLTGST